MALVKIYELKKNSAMHSWVTNVWSSNKGTVPLFDVLLYPDGGSSPRLRGTERWRSILGYPDRFIPALAGNGQLRNLQRSRHPVHPRACGERMPFFELSWPACGSSPRLRGTAPTPAESEHLLRFIPALAGNGMLSVWCRVALTVHPRACGERLFPVNPNPVLIGSSPRLRGTDPTVYHSGTIHRFIPALAGNGSNFRSETRMPAVHPRACGERGGHDGGGKVQGGSSPRLRGTGESAIEWI